jgi:hypothetical protein
MVTSRDYLMKIILFKKFYLSGALKLKYYNLIFFNKKLPFNKINHYNSYIFKNYKIYLIFSLYSKYTYIYFSKKSFLKKIYCIRLFKKLFLEK